MGPTMEGCHAPVLRQLNHALQRAWLFRSLRRARAPTASKASSLCFLMTIPRRRSRRIGEFQDGVGRAIDYATALGCTQLNCLVGLTPSPNANFIARRSFRSASLLDRGFFLNWFQNGSLM